MVDYAVKIPSTGPLALIAKPVKAIIHESDGKIDSVRPSTHGSELFQGHRRYWRYLTRACALGNTELTEEHSKQPSHHKIAEKWIFQKYRK